MEDNEIINEGGLPEEKKSADLTQSVVRDNVNQLTGSSSEPEQIQAKEKRFSILRIILFIFIPVLLTLLLFIFIIYIVPFFREIKPGQKTEITNDRDLKKDAGYKKQITLLAKDVQRLSTKYNTYTSGLSYIVINTIDNRFSLYKNKELVREGFCSSGSYTRLQTQTGKSWTFKTPKGKFTIQAKRTHPAWHRPDWSFIEEGAPIPPKDSPLRWESGVLGDYAMDLGDSYMIHGTIYKRFLGMPVTHGCVRLNDDDLKIVYNTLNVGSKVYIF
jgi:hypothetical protein